MAKNSFWLASNLGMSFDGTNSTTRMHFVGNTNAKIAETYERRARIASYESSMKELMENGVTYPTRDQSKVRTLDENGAVSGKSPYMDCTALISYLTQTPATNTGNFANHPAFQKADVAMPGDVLIYLASGNNHGVILLENGRILESSTGLHATAGGTSTGPRYSTLYHLEKKTYKDYNVAKQPYTIK